MYQFRLIQLQKLLIAYGLDGIALMPGPNMTYISGIHCHVSERPILLFIPAEDEPAIIIPQLEAMKAEQAAIPSDRIFAWTDDQGFMTAFRQANYKLELAGYLLGVESLHMRVLERDLLKRSVPDISFTHADVIMSQLRLAKDGNELAAMSRAVTVAETAMNQLIPQIKVGQTEKQLAAMLSQQLMDAGAQSIAFGPIVQSGANTASPHGVPTDRALQEGDLLLFDWGAIVDDYPSDITRTFAVGHLSDELKHIHEVVCAANDAGKSIAQAGVTGRDIDRATRQVINEAGYGQYFIHRTGHGLGLEIHEPPYIMEKNTDPLTVGNVFTIEPGIYIPDLGGVRIEDNIVITADGHQCLTSFPRELQIVGS